MAPDFRYLNIPQSREISHNMAR